MRLRIVSATLVALALAVISCSETLPTGPRAPETAPVAAPRLVVSTILPDVRISEFHYDNTGTDAGEAIEISGPADTDVTSWKLVHYNGSNGAVISTSTLNGLIPNSCSGRGVVVFNYAVNGLQNDHEGIALVDAAGAVIEFISYEGVLTATNGPALGMVSRDIGVRETGSEALGRSLWMDQKGTWHSSAPNTFGACNDATDPPAAAQVATVGLTPTSATLVQNATQQFAATARNSSNATLAGARIFWESSDPAIATVNVNGLARALQPGDVEIIAVSTYGPADTASLHVNAAPPPSGLPTTRFSEIHYDNDGTDADEKIEIEGPAGADLTGWKVVLYNGNGGGAYDTKVLSGTIPATCDARGVVVVSYAVNGIQNGSPDGMALVDATGQVVEFLSYEGTLTAADGPAAGLLSTDIVVSQNSAPVGRSLQRDATGNWYGPYTATFGACNPADPPPPSIFFSGRTSGDPPLPVGFQDQLFANLQDLSGNQVVTTFTWTSETPAVASIDANGVVTALSAGTAILRATAGTGHTDTWSLPTVVATASATAQYAGNAEFGEPEDADATDDYILRHAQFTSSYSVLRGTPNWVSYNLEATHFGPEDRCDCFTFDPALPASYPRYTTADYTGAAAINGFGIDRGHFTRSFDRTSGSLDNAYTYYFSNIIPQASDNNQGPWSAMEIYLGDLARFSNKELYIIAGVAGNKGTVKNEGKIVIPQHVWKVAVIMPRDQGLAHIDDYQDLEVVAVIMPNDPGIRSVPWETYKTTVDAVEALSGYDLLALLPDPVEIAVESNTAPPSAVVDGPYGALRGESIAMSGAGSSDPDAQALTYDWTFGDGGTGSGVNVVHAYSTGGTYTVTLIVTDPLGLADTVTTVATILSPAQAAQAARLLVGDLLTAGKISAGAANSLNSKLDAAITAFGNGQTAAAVGQLTSLLRELDAMVRSGQVTEADVAALRAYVNRVIASAS